MAEDEAHQPENWEEMLRSVLGDEAAEEILRQMGGGQTGEIFEGILHGKNFMMIGRQMQQMLQSSGNDPVNWEIAAQVAQEKVSRQKTEMLSAAQADAARGALRTASLWLDAVTEFMPAGSAAQAWTRQDWVSRSLPTFRRLLNPVGENITRAMSDAFAEQAGRMPEEIRSLIPDPTQLLHAVSGSMLGMQYGSALAELADSSFGTADTGLPLMEESAVALVPANISGFGQDLEVEEGEVLTYAAVREAAAARLYGNVPWLRPRILDTVSEYAKGIEIDTGAIEEQLRGLQIEDPRQIREIDLSDIFTLELTDAQQDALSRLEHLISLVEGWVTEISARAVAAHLPHAVPLREMFVRRYATDNPAKHVWESQLGMRLEPRQLRNAARYWQLAETKLGPEGRDAMWQHPDLLPGENDLENPEKAFENAPAGKLEAELDSFLEDLLNSEDKHKDGSED